MLTDTIFFFWGGGGGGNFSNGKFLKGQGVSEDGCVSFTGTEAPNLLYHLDWATVS
jgi:hypothetical protein